VSAKFECTSRPHINGDTVIGAKRERIADSKDLSTDSMDLVAARTHVLEPEETVGIGRRGVSRVACVAFSLRV
jgi:hypothetical protein